jgi:cysteine-rich repeat protein
MDVRTLVLVATSTLAALGCGSDLVSVDEAGSTTDPSGTGTETETGIEPGTGEGDGDGDGDGELEPICGDGTLDPFELCDDGNLIDGDGCESDCRPPACTLAWDVVDASRPSAARRSTRCRWPCATTAAS